MSIFKRSVKNAFRTVLLGWREYAGFFLALLVVQSIFWSLTFSLDTNNAIAENRVVESYSYHVIIPDLTPTQTATFKNMLNGQSVKTKILAAALDQALGETQVMKIDTHGGVKALLKLPFQTWKAMAKSDNVVILPAHRGLRVVTPLLRFWHLFYKRRLHYAVIGGWLATFLEGKKSLEKKLKKFTGIYAETNTMKRRWSPEAFAMCM